MINQVKWAIEHAIKNALIESVKKGMRKEDIRFTLTNDLLAMPECQAAIDFLLKSDYIVKLDNGEYMINAAYYEYLKTEVIK